MHRVLKTGSSGKHIIVNSAHFDSKYCIYNSSDGIYWTSAISNPFVNIRYSNGISYVTYSNNIWAILTTSNDGNCIYTSTDGSTWVPCNVSPFYINDNTRGENISKADMIAYGNGKWVAVSDIYGSVSYSNDLITWYPALNKPTL